MEIEILGQPKFWVPLTVEQTALLMKLSAAHYDMTCQRAGQLGGFIYGWHNGATWCAEHEDTYRAMATWRDLDLCLKIMEFRVPQETAEETEIRRALVLHFNRAMDLAQRAMAQWKLTYKGD